MTWVIKARCPKCDKEFERYKNNYDGQEKPPRWIACSKSCNFWLLMYIKRNGIPPELQAKIDISIGEVYDRPRNSNNQYVSWNGYRYIKVSDHPWATSGGYVLEHRLVMERYIGRYLKPSEVVHHKDGDKLNNMIDNLELMSRADHARLHRLEESNEEVASTQDNVRTTGKSS